MVTEPTGAFARFLRDFAGAPDADPLWLTETSSFGANPGELRMLSYTPADLPARAPLVVVLHGCMQSAAAYARGAGWFELAERHGFALLCPEQRAQNNPNRCFNWFQPADVARDSGEIGSIRAMAAHLIELHGLDARRVFVTGLSAGGAMAGALLAAYPEAFAGGAIVAGLPYGAAESVQQALGAMLQGRRRAPEEWGQRIRAASNHAGPWPRVSIWHGEADKTVAPLNAAALAAQWANVHGLAPEPDDHRVDGGRAHSVWTRQGAPMVELHLLSGFGHGAPVLLTGPEACGAAGPFLLAADVSSSARIAAFWNITAAPVTLAPAIEPLAAASTPSARTRRGGLGGLLRRALGALGWRRRDP